MSDEDEIMEEGFGVDSGNKLKGTGESAGANHDDIKQVLSGYYAVSFPHHPKIKIMIEETLESIVHFFSEHFHDNQVSCSEDSIDYKVLRGGSVTLAAVCQVHPQLPLDKAVIKHKCIDSLVGVIKNHKLAVVKEEATWAILNVIRGASINQIQ
ncbi:hypothetical protein DCAR_0727028 [Daucus carota subsp. sativus]|uniref:Uncharacterized protein n=1 Tax=Daucus carota subsp. sativus TaxID=79200 RepID=A0A164SPC8_DAUCS|nr:hypothetical protein DCAR_0727028 [Daucus carota subsp. sativus]